MHQPVLTTAILSHLPPLLKKGWALDATFGRGGHTKALLEKHPFLCMIAIDRDSEAVQWGLKNLKPLFPESLHIMEGDFHEYSNMMQNIFPAFLKNQRFDIIIMDLGVSSPQLDQPERGFSFYKEGPLDMRMDQRADFSAKDIINEWSAEGLQDLFYHYGEIHKPGAVVKAIIEERKRRPILHTKRLAELIQKKSGWKKKGRHPAGPYFLALRLKVNNELEGLKKALDPAVDSLNPQGRIFVLSFHSLEDRIVKNMFNSADNKKGRHITKKVIRPSFKEVQQNPRARSAVLRIFEKHQESLNK